MSGKMKGQGLVIFLNIGYRFSLDALRGILEAVP